MMRLLTPLVFLALVGTVLSATPPTPVWPSAFNADVVRYTLGTRPSEGQWYYEKSLQAERFDFVHIDHHDRHVEEKYYALHKDKMGYALTSFDGHFSCVSFNLTLPLFDPDFSAFKYNGTEDVPLDPPVKCNRWIDISSTQEAEEYLDVYSGPRVGLPVRLARRKPSGAIEALTFLTVVKGPQPAYLFEVADSIKAECRHVGSQEMVQAALQKLLKKH